MVSRFFFKLFIVVLMIWTGYETVTGFFENRAFKKHGKTAETEQILKYEQTVHTTKSRGHSPDVRVVNEAMISFMTAENLKISVNKKLPQDIMEKYQKHEQVNIEYVSTEPQTTRWVGERRDVRGDFLVFLVLAVIVFFSFFFGGSNKD